MSKKISDDFYRFFTECNRTFKTICYQSYIKELMKHSSLYEFLEHNKSDKNLKISLDKISDIAKKYNIHHIEILPFSIIQIITSDEKCHIFRVRKNGKLYEVELTIEQISELMRKLDYTRYLIEMRVDKKEELDYQLNQMIKFICNRSNRTQEFFTKYSMSNDCWENLLDFNTIFNKIEKKYKNAKYETSNDRVYTITIKTRRLIREIDIDYNGDLIRVDLRTKRI